LQCNTPLEMKKIEAIIRKSKFDEVRKALHEANVYFFSYWDVTGIGHETKGKVYRGVHYSTSDIQRRFLSIVVNDDFVDVTIEAILKAGKTGEVGDGKIFVSPIEETYRIRTGESGGETLK
jgi:nitrogen regulatory protein P-II 1